MYIYARQPSSSQYRRQHKPITLRSLGRRYASGPKKTVAGSLRKKLSEVKTSLDIDRAVRLNRQYARSVGWQVYFDRIVRLVGFTTFTPNERLFAEAVARWQQHEGLPAIGAIGPKTWSRMQTKFSIATRPAVKTTYSLERVVYDLEPYFQKEGLQVQQTSGYRSPEYQLELIKRKAIEYGLDKKYPSIRTATVADVESWRGAWDELLNKHGYIINPPVPTESRLAGRTILASTHSSGKAFDLSTYKRTDLARIAAVVQRYKQDGGPIKQILIERKNNAVHVTLY